MTRRLLVALGIVAVLAGARPAARQDLTQKEADSMGRKLLSILERGALPPARARRAARVSFTEREVNAYLKFYGESQAPVGIVEPRILIADGGRLEGRALVDLDAVRKAKVRGWVDPLAYVTGSVEVRAIGTLKTANGKGVFGLQSATLGGVPIPKTLLQELVSYYTRTPESPAGFSLDDPFELPHNIRQVEIQRGAATIIQ